MKIILVLLRTFFFYIMIMMFYRIMGKREVGELKIMDFVVSMFIANLVAMGIERYDENIFLSLGPVLLLVILQIVFSKMAFKNSKIRGVIDGEPSVIINRGKINFKEMLRQRYNLDDLLMELRSNGIKSIEEVDYAVLEVSGGLSVFKKNEDGEEYPLPLILNGKVDDSVLIQIGKDEEWLDNVLIREGYNLKEVFYGFYKDNQVFLIRSENIK